VRGVFQGSAAPTAAAPTAQASPKLKRIESRIETMLESPILA